MYKLSYRLPDEQYLLWLCSLTVVYFTPALMARASSTSAYWTGYFCLECCCLKSSFLLPSRNRHPHLFLVEDPNAFASPGPRGVSKGEIKMSNEIQRRPDQHSVFLKGAPYV
jgi:hypothetical protein